MPSNLGIRSKLKSLIAHGKQKKGDGKAQSSSRSSPVLSHTPTNPKVAPGPSRISSADSEPWEAWKLDQEFLRELSDWNAKHPETNLVRNTSVLIDQGKELLEVIPDGPIPFRGFVKALTCLVRLGMTVAEARANALRFSQDILRWVEKLAAAFGGDRVGDFTSKTWENLVEIRDLIDEICIWAHARLNDSSTQRLAEGMFIKNAIEDFESRFRKAAERFGVLSTINIAQGQDHMFHMMSDARDKASEMNLANERREFLEKTLSLRPVPDATYEYQEKHPCDPDTRVDILREIRDWVNDISDNAKCFYWLSGDPGVGKSAITASIARECKDSKVLWAQFFINRNDVRTTEPRSFFPAIARQMSENSPDVAQAVVTALKDQPSLVDDISLGQAKKLFVETIRVASASSSMRPVVIVIDALDETDFKRLRDVAEIFSEVIIDLPRNAKVFISSRAEDVIRNTFSQTFSSQRVMHKHLAAASSIGEVANFLERNVKQILKDYDLDWSQWGDGRMQELRVQGSGLYIWAVTAIQFVRAEIEASGSECLVAVLDELNTKGMNDINVLYMTILRRTLKAGTDDTDGWVFQRFRRIVGAILVQCRPLRLVDLKELLNMYNPRTQQPVDIIHFVRRYRTVLVAGSDKIDSQTVPQMHKTFADFIVSERARDFRVDTTASNGELVFQCIHQLIRVYNHPMPVADHFPVQLSYTARHLYEHLSRLLEFANDNGEGHSYDDDEIPGTPPNNEDTLLNSTNHTRSNLTDDSTQGSSRQTIPYHYEDHQSNTTNSILCSPDGSRTMLVCSDGTVHIRNAGTGAAVLDPISHPGAALPITATFSPDSTRILLASGDGTICVRDVSTGGLTLGPMIVGHASAVVSAEFSPDGTHILSASRDGTICVWNAVTGTIENGLSLIGGHSSTVFSAAFSSDGARILSASRDGTICIWNASSGELVLKLASHTGVLVSAVFSPEYKCILSASNDGTISVWDASTGQLITAPHEAGIDLVQLSITDTKTGQYFRTPHALLLKTNMSHPSIRLEHGSVHLRTFKVDNWLYDIWIDLDDTVIHYAYGGVVTHLRTAWSVRETSRDLRHITCVL